MERNSIRMYLESLTCHDHGRIRIQPVCESVNNMNRDSLSWIQSMNCFYEELMRK